MRAAFAIAISAVSLGLAAATAVSCASSPDRDRVTEVITPDFDTYVQSVDAYLTRRCGSLDCHGALPRGLRVYGSNSLRLPNGAGLVVGSGTTTPGEALATYVSLIGLQPEKMDAFARSSPRTEADAYGLLILAKPLAIERHRPGASLRKGEPTERCVLSWLLGATDAATCQAAAPPLQ